MPKLGDINASMTARLDKQDPGVRRGGRRAARLAEILPPGVLSIDQAAGLLGCGRDRVGQLVDLGKLMPFWGERIRAGTAGWCRGVMQSRVEDYLTGQAGEDAGNGQQADESLS